MSVSKLGARVQRFRENKNMSREELADLAGISLRAVVALEEQNIYASVAPLQKVARALEVRMGTFMDDVSSKDPLIVRCSDREADLVMHKNVAEESFYKFYSLGKGKNDRNMEPFFVEIQPDVEEPFSSHQGEEFIVVVSGSLKVIYGKERHELGVGDTIYFNSIVPHFVGAAKDAPCSIFAVIYYP